MSDSGEMALTAGTRLGPYEVLSGLGAGGMGEVYRARDARLGREVAVKVLPTAFAADAERLRRFEQEARAAAALNHPNILAVYDLGTYDGAPYVVSELLHGQTLREALATGPLPVRKVIDYAIQIAHGLTAAHEKGIVHRDLKPENLFVTSDSLVKILDFGLVKLIESATVEADGLSALATRTADTTPGVVLGTIGYMSPEQVRGRAVDHRSDLFSFGGILYEMLSGRRAFTGETPADTMSAILNRDPPELTAIANGAVSPPLERIARHCLEKDPRQRFQSARDLAFDLEALSGSSGPAAAGRPPSPSSRHPRKALLVAGLLGIACGGLAVGLILRSLAKGAADSPVVQHVARVTHETGFSEWPTWSPDGRLFAFASNRSGNFEIYVRRFEGGQEVNVTNSPAEDVQPAFSPDGTSLAFVSTRSSQTGLVKISTFTGLETRTYGGDVWVAPALGGQARRVAENGNFPVWHPSGSALLYVTGQESHRTIFEVSIDGGRPSPILPATASTWEIVRLGSAPGARWITFESVDRRVFAMPAAGGQPTELLRGNNHVWDPAGGRVYYLAQEPSGGTRIEAADLQERAGGLTVAPMVLVGVSTGTLRDLAIAADRQHLLASGVEESLNLSRVPLAPGGGDVAGPEEELSGGQVRDRYPVVSPDGRRIALSSNRIGQQDLWMVDLASRRWERVQMPANTGTWITHACWAQDGKHLAVRRILQDGTSAYWYIAIDGSSAEQLLPPTPASAVGFSCAVSPDGRRLVYSHMAGGYSQLFVLDMASRREEQLTLSPSDKYEGLWSPDGQWLAFSANTGATVQVWRMPAAGGDEQQLTTGFERMRHLFYSPDGRWLYVQPNHRNIYRMPADGGRLQQVTRFPESGLFLEEPTIAPDGRWLAYCRGRGGSSLWMLTLGTE